MSFCPFLPSLPPFLLILHCQVPFSCGSPKTRLEGAPTPQSPGPPVAGIILSNCRGPQPPTHNQPFVLFSVLTAIGTFLIPFTIKFTQPDIELAGQECQKHIWNLFHAILPTYCDRASKIVLDFFKSHTKTFHFSFLRNHNFVPSPLLTSNGK